MESASARINLAPQCSLTPRQARAFFLSLCAGCLGLSGLFALRGYWPMLPFAGLEMLALGLALKVSLDRRHQLQTILISEDEVRVEMIRKGRQTRCLVFSRHWARVTLLQTSVRSRPSRLLIEASGRSCEVGQFLTEEERRGIARQLGRLIGRTAESPPLGSA